MLSYYFKIEEIDDGVRDFAVNLNRIPGVHTATNCEGHVYRDTPLLPTKDGWVHFSHVREGQYEDLIKRIRGFEATHPGFELQGGIPLNDTYPFINYTIHGKYESHENGRLFDRLNKEEQESYYQRAELRRLEILNGWKDLNEVVEQYLRGRFGDNFNSLPYKNSAPDD